MSSLSFPEYPSDVVKEIRIDGEGKATLSIRGASRVSGIPRSTLHYHFSSGQEKPSKLAKKLLAHGFDPGQFSESGLPDTAFAIVVGFFAKQEPDNEELERLDDVFRSIGVRLWAQQITGWSGVKLYSLDQIVCREPLIWERMFKPEWIDWAEKTTGWQWKWSCMGQFINHTCYDYLPSDVVVLLRELNPKNENGNRIHKHHQFLQSEIRDIVTKHLEEVLTLMKGADGNLSLFEILMSNRFGRYRVLESNPDQPLLFKSEIRYIPASATKPADGTGVN